VEDPADDPVAQLRYALRQVLNREAERQKPRTLDFEPVVEHGDANGRTSLSVVRMNDRVDDRFAHRGRWNAPSFDPSHRTDLGAVHGVLGNEGNRLLDRAHRQRVNLDVVDDPALVLARETACLYPRVWKIPLTVLSEQEDTTDRRHQPALVDGEQPQRLEITAGQRANRRKALGSCSEVHCFRVELCHSTSVASGWRCRLAKTRPEPDFR